jgi:hypothetical protein
VKGSAECYGAVLFLTFFVSRSQEAFNCATSLFVYSVFDECRISAQNREQNEAWAGLAMSIAACGRVCCLEITFRRKTKSRPNVGI